MREDTALHLLRRSREEFERDIIGAIVLTGYNNRTYRIVAIDWDKSPTSTFANREGQQQRILDYYKNRYNIQIREARQPLLVAEMKAREIRGGENKTPALLVPELCRMTGLTDGKNFNKHFKCTIMNFLFS